MKRCWSAAVVVLLALASWPDQPLAQAPRSAVRKPVAKPAAARRATAPVRARRNQARPRRFRIDEGRNINLFHQSAKLAAHTVIRRGHKPRIVVATPAGNSGIGIWFSDVAKGAGELAVKGNVREVVRDQTPGVAFTVTGPARLNVRRILLDSVRALRDENANAYQHRAATIDGALAALDQAPDSNGVKLLARRLETWVRPSVTRLSDGTVVVERTAVAGANYRLELVPMAGTDIRTGPGNGIELRGKRATQFEVRAFIGRPALAPLGRVLGKHGSRNQRGTQERNLGFLGYREAFLAGSWQYLTYFGRDTLITSSLIAKRAHPETLSAAVGSVLDRVSRRGEIAHEESIGDQATLERIDTFARRVARGKTRVTPARLAALEKPTYEYKMIDGEYLLPHVVDALVEGASPAAVRSTLTDARIDALARVAVRIAGQTGQYRGDKRGLVRLRRGETVGNWRDSGIGLGGGVVPLDVNAYLVPAALDRLAGLLERPGFPRGKFLAALAKRDPRARELFGSAKHLRARARTWQTARDRFEVKLSSGQARARLRSYLDSLPGEQRKALVDAKLWSGVTIADAIAGKAAAELDGVRIPSLALDARGKPVPVQSSDEAFDLFYGQPTREQVLDSVRRMFQPFPVGLATPVGLVVANPGYSDRPGDRATFGPDKYHGAVIWGWVQNMVAQGLDRQARRFAGDAEVQRTIGRAQKQLQGALKKAGTFSASELWTWTAQGGQVQAQAFGLGQTDTDESNAVQLWSNTR